MATINCTKCGAVIEVPELQGDYSTFVCQTCNDKVNFEAYQEESKALEANEFRTESEDRRIAFLKAKIASIV